jgi:adenylate cyclase
MAAIANPYGRLILIVDDEPMILRSVSATLAEAGFRIMVAENGAAGLDAFLRLAEQIDLVLTDVVMPIMDGIAMADSIKSHTPDARIVLMTGYSEPVIAGMRGGSYPLIRKPFLSEDLLRIIKANLDPPAATA